MLTATFVRPQDASTVRDTSLVLTILESPLLKLVKAGREGREVWCIVEAGAAPDMDALLQCTDPAQSTFRKVLDYDGIAILVTEAEHHVRLDVLRTLHATVPLYIAHDSDRVILSWDFLRCARAVPTSLDVNACRRLIANGPSLDTDTILHGVKLLAGGQHGALIASTLEIGESQPPTSYETSVLSPNSEAALYFLDLIAEVISPHLKTARAAALELSGGLDSSCVAAALPRTTATLQQFSTYGLIHAGPAGLQQTARRNELIGLFSLTDTTAPSTSCQPFAYTRDLTRRVPSDEFFRSGIEACLASLPRWPDLIITGIGGDEITLLKSRAPADCDERNNFVTLFGEAVSEEKAVPTVPSGSAVASAFCRADMFLSRGIWPVNPLMHPKLVQFSQALPLEMKRSRLLNKIALAKVGLSDHFLFPRYRENFAQMYDTDLRHFDLTAYLERALIHDRGIVDCSALLRQHILFVNSGKCDVPLTCFGNAVRLEHFLRLLTTRETIN